MKRLIVPYLENLNNSTPEAAADILEDLGQRDAIETLNWKQAFPYKPITFFYIGRSDDSLFIKYSVHGSMLKAIYTKDQQPVNEDSCVELFCKIPGKDPYMTFEFNCIGACKASRRLSRHKEVNYFSPEEMAQIKRYSTIGNRAFQEMEGMFEWELTVKIPFRIMGIDPANLPEKLMANFYKCADVTDSRHYVTWSKIDSEKPDFHRPDSFGELSFS